MMTIKEIRNRSGLSQAAFGDKYSIPKRTIENWEADEGKKEHRNCPDYVLKLLDRVVREDYES